MNKLSKSTATSVTIAIPTYNRTEILLENVRLLVPQLIPGFRLLIIDNASEASVADALGEIISGCPAGTINVVRNRANIGGNANICRCFELCDTEWIWILGDDDRPEPGMVEKVSEMLAENRKYCAINFGIHAINRRADREVENVDELVCKLDNFSNILFISSTIYNAPLLKSKLHLGCHFTYSCAPHLVMLFSCITPNSPLLLRAQHLIEHQTPDGAQSLPAVRLALGFPILCEALPETHQRAFMEVILRDFGILRLACAVLVVESQKNHMRAAMMSNNLLHRYLGFSVGWRNRSLLYGTKFICIMPVFVGQIVVGLSSVTGKSLVAGSLKRGNDTRL
jgi:hypothetical protein